MSSGGLHHRGVGARGVGRPDPFTNSSALGERARSSQWEMRAAVTFVYRHQVKLCRVNGLARGAGRGIRSWHNGNGWCMTMRRFTSNERLETLAFDLGWDSGSRSITRNWLQTSSGVAEKSWHSVCPGDRTSGGGRSFAWVWCFHRQSSRDQRTPASLRSLWMSSPVDPGPSRFAATPLRRPRRRADDAVFQSAIDRRRRGPARSVPMRRWPGSAPRSDPEEIHTRSLATSPWRVSPPPRPPKSASPSSGVSDQRRVRGYRVIGVLRFGRGIHFCRRIRWHPPPKS